MWSLELGPWTTDISIEYSAITVKDVKDIHRPKLVLLRRYKFQKRTILRPGREMILDMKFQWQLVPRLNLEQEGESSDGQINRVVGHILPNAPPGSQAERVPA